MWIYKCIVSRRDKPDVICIQESFYMWQLGKMGKMVEEEGVSLKQGFPTECTSTYIPFGFMRATGLNTQL